MRPKPLPSQGDDLFRSRLDAIINARHPLMRLAGLIDWARFDEAFGSLYAETGRPGLPTRLMVGLHLLKHMKGLSDEEICAQWVENPYMQAFCGEAFFRHVLPLDRSSLTRWRNRIGADQLEVLLAETIAAATRSEALHPERMERVTIDTSVQTKAVAHPTDSHLLLRGIEWLNRLARKHGVRLRQSFLRLATRARREVGRRVHTRGHAQAMRYVRKMRTWLGRLERDIGRKIAGDAALGMRPWRPLSRPPGPASRACWRNALRTRTRSMPCTRPRWSASPKAKRGPATSSGSSSRWRSPTPGRTAGSLCWGSERCRATRMTDTRSALRSSRLSA